MNGCLAVIPARGGSKRIPGKNLRSLRGRPLIAYTIEAALRSELFDRVVVTTDSGEIADVAIECGAEVPFLRDSSLSDDFVPVSPQPSTRSIVLTRQGRSSCTSVSSWRTAP